MNSVSPGGPYAKCMYIQIYTPIHKIYTLCVLKQYTETDTQHKSWWFSDYIHMHVSYNAGAFESIKAQELIVSGGEGMFKHSAIAGIACPMQSVGETSLQTGQ